MRNAARVEKTPQLAHPVLMAGALEGTCLQMLDRGDRAGGKRRRQGRREDETGGKRADEVTDRRRAGNITAHHAKSFAERPFDNRKAIHETFALGNAAAARSVHANGVNLIEIGHGAVTIGEIADFLDRRDIAVHRIDRLKSDELRRVRIGRLEFRLEIFEIIVLPDHPLATAVTDAFDHRRMVQRIGENDQARNFLAERTECRPVGHITGGEDQRRFLAVQIGEFLFKQNMVMIGARNIPGASRTRATVIDGGFHGFDDFRVLAHAEIIVGAPDRYVLALAIGVVPCRAGKIALLALDIRKNAIASLRMQALQFRREKCLEVHAMLQN